MKLTTNINIVGENGPTSSYMFDLLTERSSTNYYTPQRQDEEGPGQHVLLTKPAEQTCWTRIENEWDNVDIPTPSIYHWHSLIPNKNNSSSGVTTNMVDGHVTVKGTATRLIDGWRFSGNITDISIDHVYYIGARNIKCGEDMSTMEDRDSGLFVYNMGAARNVFTITKFGTAAPLIPWGDHAVVRKQLQANPESLPCVYLSAIEGDVLNIEFDVCIIDLTELAGVTEEISVEEAEKLIIEYTGCIRADYAPENRMKSLQYETPQATLRMYFPQYSVDTYDPYATYALTTCIYINGVEVELGSYIFERTDALAYPTTQFGNSENYYEYIDFLIPNPYRMLFARDGQWLRLLLTGSIDPTNDALLNISLNPATLVDEHYIKADNWTGGQNSILIHDPIDLHLSISYDALERYITMRLTYNEEYKSLYNYISKCYNCNDSYVLLQYVMMNNDDIFLEQTKLERIDQSSTGNTYSLDTDKFTYSWDDWKEGMWIQGSISLYDVNVWSETDILNDNAIPYITLFSNRLPVDQDLFGQIIRSENYDEFPNKISFSSIANMNEYKIIAINTIKQEVNILTPNPDSTKDHITQPVFYQVRELNRVNVHPEVTENVSINLDAYKSRVKSFAIQIEGTVFKEIGRTNKGIVFKVVGKMLPKEVDNGVLYVLDQDGTLVTTGKYNYIY